MLISDWFSRWRIPAEAQAELRAGLVDGTLPPSIGLTSEAGVQSVVRMEASAKGGRLWRNNVGAMYDPTGRFVRFGLANDSEQMNKQFKSADLIGIMPLLITPAHVGSVVGQFTSRECKKPDWKYSGDAREAAQMRWAELILALGGNASFTTGPGTL